MSQRVGVSLWALSINSIACYVLAFLVTTVLHELGHAIVGALLGSNPVLHHNYVAHFDRDALPIAHQAWIALAGPVVSLVQGLVIALWWQNKEGGGVFRLFMLWAMLLGFGNFLGYLMTGPFFTGGDIGKVHELLNVALWCRIIIAVIGGAALTFVAYRVTRPFLQFTPDQASLENDTTRTRFAFRIIILPWLIGAVIVTLLYLPIIAIVSIIYPISSGMVFIFPWKNARRIKDAKACGRAEIGHISAALLITLLIAVCIFRFVLAPGIAI